MAQAKTIPFTRHPYADGSFKKMLIDGKWAAAASGKTVESHNPATGEQAERLRSRRAAAQRMEPDRRLDGRRRTCGAQRRGWGHHLLLSRA